MSIGALQCTHNHMPINQSIMHESESEIMLRVVVVDAYLSCQYATARGLLRAIQTSITRSSCSEHGHNSIAIVSDSLGHNRSPSSHYRHHRADTKPDQSITDPSRRYVCVRLRLLRVCRTSTGSCSCGLCASSRYTVLKSPSEHACRNMSSTVVPTSGLVSM